MEVAEEMEGEEEPEEDDNCNWKKWIEKAKDDSWTGEMEGN